MKTAAIVVDYQKGFGDKQVNELYVPEGELIVGDINTRITRIKEREGLVIASRELHQIGNIGFASSYKDKFPITAVPAGDTRWFVSLQEVQSIGPDILSAQAGFSYQELLAYLESTGGFLPLWPDHCVDGTVGSEYVDGFAQELVDVEVIKGDTYNSHPFSAAYAMNAIYKASLIEILAQNEVEEVEVMWLATDYCVKDTALDIAKIGRYKVSLILGSVRGVSPESTVQAIGLMKQNSITIR